MSENSKSEIHPMQNQKTQALQFKIPFRSQLRTRLTILLTILAVLPVVVVLYAVLNQASVQTGKQVELQLQTVTALKRDQLVRWLDESRASLDLLLANRTRNELVIALIKISFTDELLANDRTAQLIISNLLIDAVKAQPAFKELFIYNANGRVIAASNETQLGKVVTRQPYFAGSLIDSYVQPPYYEIGTNELVMFVTHPLVADDGQTVGVLAGKLNLDVLGEIIGDYSGLGETGETYLVSRESNYLLTPSRFPGYPLIFAYRSEGIDRVLSGESGKGAYTSYRDLPVIGSYLWIPELQAGLLAEIEQEEAFAPFIPTRDRSIYVAVATAIGALFLGFYATTRFVKPISGLTQVAARIAEGDLNQRAGIVRHDEVGLLATVFNRMTIQLQDLIGSLEDRVADRTRRLETVASLSEQLTAILDFDQLLAQLVNQVKAQFDYYHAHVYIIDKDRQQLIMTAGAGAAGLQMKAQGHAIPLARQDSLVARAARTGQIVRVDNVRDAEDWLPNPLLPDTYAEMAVPITLGVEGEIVGVLDVQEDEVGGLDESDASLLRSLANQVAVAIRNARLFSEVETALADARAAQERYLNQAWANTTVTSQKREHLYQRPGVSALAEAMLAEAKQQALLQNKPTALSLDNAGSNAQSVVAPVIIGGQKIGALQLHKMDANGEAIFWSEHDLTVVEAVLDQVAQIAENLRLFDEVRQQADYEYRVSQVTQKIRQAPTFEAVVRTAAEALGNVLDMSDVVVRLNVNNGSEEAHTPEENGHA